MTAWLMSLPDWAVYAMGALAIGLAGMLCAIVLRWLFAPRYDDTPPSVHRQQQQRRNAFPTTCTWDGEAVRAYRAGLPDRSKDESNHE